MLGTTLEYTQCIRILPRLWKNVPLLLTRSQQQHYLEQNNTKLDKWKELQQNKRKVYSRGSSSLRLCLQWSNPAQMSWDISVRIKRTNQPTNLFYVIVGFLFHIVTYHNEMLFPKATFHDNGVSALSLSPCASLKPASTIATTKCLLEQRSCQFIRFLITGEIILCLLCSCL